MAIETDTFLDELRQKRENQDWLDRNRSELRRRFPGKYVAVLRGKVVGAEEDFTSLLSGLRREFPDTSPSLAAVDFLSEEEYVWVL
jgi:hypothetical protein